MKKLFFTPGIGFFPLVGGEIGGHNCSENQKIERNNMKMSTMLLTLWASVLTVFLLISFGNSQTAAQQQKNDVDALKAEIFNLRTAALLVGQDHWYFVRPDEVSSEPYSNGTIVFFDCPMWVERTWDNKGNTSKFYNSKIRFSFKGRSAENGAEPVAGFVSYKFLD